MTEIGVGLIGYGLAGRAFHAPFVEVTPGLALRAVVSRDAAKVQADLPDVAVCPDVPTLLARDDIGLVIVASPDDLHAEHALAALAAGKHLLVDKPFATSLADARRVADAAEAAGRLVTIFQNRRWDADFLTLQGLIAEGRLGAVVQFESHFDRWRPQPAPVWKEARTGGAWLDLGPHLVDQALQLFGLPTAVSADIATLRVGAPSADYFHVTLKYPDRRAILHSSKLVAEHSLRFAVHGTGGSWIKHGFDPQEAASLRGVVPGGEKWGVDSVPGRFTGADGASDEVAGVPGDYCLFWNALAAALRGEGANPVPPAEAIAVMRVLDAALRSADLGGEVVLADA
ncbi:putative dehydrogenase [Sphingomonas zeicaulis]|uniref:oxidoreductase n=1 Tax=Sphingomonas zeicaulis TaxID=1632740 RepID=UPI003D221656